MSVTLAPQCLRTRPLQVPCGIPGIKEQTVTFFLNRKLGRQIKWMSQNQGLPWRPIGGSVFKIHVCGRWRSPQLRQNTEQPLVNSHPPMGPGFHFPGLLALPSSSAVLVTTGVELQLPSTFPLPPPTARLLLSPLGICPRDQTWAARGGPRRQSGMQPPSDSRAALAEASFSPRSLSWL